jgi:hypothetical protein
MPAIDDMLAMPELNRPLDVLPTAVSVVVLSSPLADPACIRIITVCRMTASKARAAHISSSKRLSTAGLELASATTVCC